MVLLLVCHLIETLHVFLRLAIHIMEFLVPVHGLAGRHLQDDGNLGVAQNVNVIKFRTKLALGGVFVNARGVRHG
jgi:hypothetical protein